MQFDEDDPGQLDTCDFLMFLRQDLAYLQGVADTAGHEGMARTLDRIRDNVEAFEAWIEDIKPEEKEGDDDDAE